MAQDLTISNAAFGKQALPAHLQHLADKPSEIVTSGGPSVPSLSVRGKTFTINDGEAKPLMKVDADTGEQIPLGALSVVVVDYAAKNGRQYYEGAFDPKESKPPTCYSLDGVVPEDDSEAKQSPKCATCKWAQKGSKVSEQSGKGVAACSNLRNLAVIPAATLDGQVPLMRLKLAQTSIYDGKSPQLRQEGKFAFENYLQALKSKQIPSVDSIVTVIAFDTTAGLTYPKLTFRAHRFLEPHEYEKIQAIKHSGKVDEILGWTSTLALAEGRGHRDAEPTEPAVGNASAHPADAALARAGANNPALNTEDTMGRKAANQTAVTTIDEDPEDREIRLAQERKAKRLADEAAKAAAAKAAAAAPSKAIGDFVAPKQDAGEDEDDYNIRVAQARKAHKIAQAAAIAAAAQAKPAAEFKAPAQDAGEDEDDYAVRVAQVRKAWKLAQASAGPVAAPEFKAPPQEEGEDEDDYAVRVAQARKAHKLKHGAPAAAAAPPPFVAPEAEEGEDEDDHAVRVAQARKAYKAKYGAPVVAPVADKPTRTRRTKEQMAADAAKGGEKFLPEEAAAAATMAAIAGDDEPAPTKAKIEPNAATPVPGVSDEVSAMLTGWQED